MTDDLVAQGELLIEEYALEARRRRARGEPDPEPVVLDPEQRRDIDSLAAEAEGYIGEIEKRSLLARLRDLRHPRSRLPEPLPVPPPPEPEPAEDLPLAAMVERAATVPERRALPAGEERPVVTSVAAMVRHAQSVQDRIGGRCPRTGRASG